MGHVSLVYIDDGISGSKDLLTAKAASVIQRRDLSHSGLKVNEEKTDWQPRQIGQWLGFIIDTIRMTFQVPPKKLEKFKRAISDVLNSSTVSLSLLHTSDVSAIASARTFTLEHKRRKRGGLYLALTIALTFCRFTLEDF